MGGLQVFTSPEFGQLEILLIGGKEFFPAITCATVLGYSNPRDAVLRHCKGVVKHDVPTAGGTQSANYIPEGDLYRLIIRSNLPTADKFERWVFDEVLPQIRKAGSYVQPLSQVQILQHAVNILAEQEKKVQVLEHRVNTLDGIQIAGTKRQQLNAMIRKYAFDNGFTFSRAWQDFISAFNLAYKMNLTARVKNAGAKSTPHYLEKADMLEDALRVADKLLNSAKSA